MHVSPSRSFLAKIELHLACHNLKNLDRFSKSDPQIFVFVEDTILSRWKEVGRTEMIKDNLNPVFTKPIIVEYNFQELIKLRFVVVDIDKEGGKLEEQDLIGTVETSLAEIVSFQEQTICKRLIAPKQDKYVGDLTITAEEVRDFSSVVHLTLEGFKLDRKDFFGLGRSDPFIRISRARRDGRWEAVHQTEVIKFNLNPRWRTIKVSVQQLCNGAWDRPLLFECFDWNRSGKQDLIGAFQTTLGELAVAGKTCGSFSLIEPSKRNKKSSYRNSGIIRVSQCEIMQEPTFLDFIRGGCEIDLVVAVDFTASNGDPDYATSKHYRNPYTPNDYMLAIQSVGEILVNYTQSHLISAFGFGARPTKSAFRVSHCFALNGDDNRPEVNGVEGLLEAYYTSLNRVQLAGPTNFATIIRKASEIASAPTDKQRYTILLFLTDGEITDMKATVAELVRASSLPLSVVIIGIGDANFSKMDFLDADDNPLVYEGQQAERDIVQFVPFSKYKDLQSSKLAEETLKEIPEQMVSFFQSRNIYPIGWHDKQRQIPVGQPLPHLLLQQSGYIQQPNSYMHQSASMIPPSVAYPYPSQNNNMFMVPPAQMLNNSMTFNNNQQPTQISLNKSPQQSISLDKSPQPISLVKEPQRILLEKQPEEPEQEPYHHTRENSNSQGESSISLEKLEENPTSSSSVSSLYNPASANSSFSTQ